MTCEEAREMLTQPPDTRTAAEVTAAVLHTRKCPSCRGDMEKRMPKAIKDLTPEQLAAGLRATGGSETLKRIINDEECLSQIAEHLKVDPDRIKFVAKNLFGTDIVSGPVSEKRGCSHKDDDFKWSVTEDAISQLADSCINTMSLAYTSTMTEGDIEENIQKAADKTIAFLRPLFERTGAKFDSEKRECSLQNMQAFARKVLAAVAEHISEILKGKQ